MRPYPPLSQGSTASPPAYFARTKFLKLFLNKYPTPISREYPITTCLLCKDKILVVVLTPTCAVPLRRLVLLRAQNLEAKTLPKGQRALCLCHQHTFALHFLKRCTHVRSAHPRPPQALCDDHTLQQTCGVWSEICEQFFFPLDECH
eukprot:CAMPEP_0173396244 /NCGR_PEP_ID=MMETSP1356-20130122/34933_1 /TAXON_ID=77927 ORGANISM="Hemiselmis virescens, Strain PCC157" /NCGR_SAMPLE_ID=MMETSP1356 /ASSEMBLY_ACC=CAM_ASM_000847 /LENGTH=146 /DNA_ID=CAMNT_0014355221 /DNA_START=19 /DNA_END=460 /DNA_ORIENTATION=-